ncbi:unnamed protein product [Discosporangium mesarthrocarpum]
MEGKNGTDFVLQEALVGHRGQVLCVAAPGAQAGRGLVATGSEDSTVRLWDLRPPQGPGRTTLCICRCFGGEGVACVEFSPVDSDRLFCAAGGQVLEFDLRMGARGLLLTEPKGIFNTGEEEVNQLSLHPKSGEYLAVADDSGEVRVYHTATRARHKILRHIHTNICNTVQFRPSSSWDLASGGLDSTLVFWDFSSGHVRSVADLTASPVRGTASASTATPSQLLNPPFVNSLSFTRDGGHLAAALGDATVAVFDPRERRILGRCSGHRAPVAQQVHFSVFDPEVLVSTGNDCRMLIWDRQTFTIETPPSLDSAEAPAAGNPPGVANNSMATTAAQPACKSLGSGKRTGQHKKKKKRGAPGGNPSGVRSEGEDGGLGQGLGLGAGGDTGAGAGARGGGTEPGGVVEWKSPLAVVDLGDKPNWVTSCLSPCECLLLADTSNSVKVLRPARS